MDPADLDGDGRQLVFGLAAGPVVRDAAAPAASALLHPTWWGTLALGRGSSVPPLSVPIDLLRPETIGTAVAELVIGLLLLRALPRLQRMVEPLRRMHTGSANDYAAFSMVGVIACAIVLLG